MLKPCETCGTDISSLAKMCPHCGDPEPHRDGCATCLTGCAFLLVLLVFFAACFVGAGMLFGG